MHTYDVNCHYSQNRIRKAAALIQKNFGRDDILREVEQSGELPAGIYYHPRYDLTEKTPHGVFDLCCSKFVLEHVSPDVLRRIHEVSDGWMAELGLWVHWVSPSDHRSYDDSRIHQVEFLEMSEDDWVGRYGNRFAYHNRLRRPQYIDIFRESNFDILVDDCSVPSDALEQVRSLEVHQDFSKFTAEELMAANCWFVLRRRSRHAVR